MPFSVLRWVNKPKQRKASWILKNAQLAEMNTLTNAMIATSQKLQTLSKKNTIHCLTKLTIALSGALIKKESIMNNNIQILNMLDDGYHIYLNDSYFDQSATKAEADLKVLDMKADIAASESGA